MGLITDRHPHWESRRLKSNLQEQEDNAASGKWKGIDVGLERC